MHLKMVSQFELGLMLDGVRVYALCLVHDQGSDGHYASDRYMKE